MAQNNMELFEQQQHIQKTRCSQKLPVTAKSKSVMKIFYKPF